MCLTSGQSEIDYGLSKNGSSAHLNNRVGQRSPEVSGYADTAWIYELLLLLLLLPLLSSFCCNCFYLVVVLAYVVCLLVCFLRFDYFEFFSPQSVDKSLVVVYESLFFLLFGVLVFRFTFLPSPPSSSSSSSSSSSASSVCAELIVRFLMLLFFFSPPPPPPSFPIQSYFVFPFFFHLFTFSYFISFVCVCSFEIYQLCFCWSFRIGLFVISSLFRFFFPPSSFSSSSHSFVFFLSVVFVCYALRHLGTVLVWLCSILCRVVLHCIASLCLV